MLYLFIVQVDTINLYYIQVILTYCILVSWIKVNLKFLNDSNVEFLSWFGFD